MTQLKQQPNEAAASNQPTTVLILVEGEVSADLLLDIQDLLALLSAIDEPSARPDQPIQIPLFIFTD